MSARGKFVVKGFQIIVSQVGQRRMNVHTHQDVVNNAIIIRQRARVQDISKCLGQFMGAATTATIQVIVPSGAPDAK